jgi:phage shock protein PspC (stress-responsive transcriptional regulator)
MSYTTPPPDAGPRVTRDQMRDISSLRRASDQRMVAGVAEGLSRHFDVDPILIRVVFAALTLFGGAGIALYVIAWVTIPEETQYDSALSKLLRRDPNRVMVAGLAVAAVIGLATTIGAIGFSAPNPIPLIIVSGLAIGALALFSRRADRRQPPPPPFPGPSSPPSSFPPGYAGPVPPPAAGAPGGTAYTAAAPPAAADAATSADDPDATAGSGTATAPPLPPPTREWWQRPDQRGPGGPGGPMPPPQAYPPPPPPKAREPRSHLFAITMAVIAIAIGTVWILDETVYDSMPASVYPGTVLGVTALALLVGSWYGRSRLLIAVGILATLTTVAAAAAGPGPYGERIYRPSSVAELHTRYDHGVGRMVVHLENLTDPEDLDGRTIDVDAHIGQVEVVVPSTLPVTIDAHVDHGEIEGPPQSNVTRLDDGGEEITMSSVTSGSAALNLNIDLDFGQIVVTQWDCLGPRLFDPRSDVPRLTPGLDTSNQIGAPHAAPACN